EQRDTHCQEKQHAETDAQVAMSGGGHCRFERAALMLHDQQPSSELFIAPRGKSIRPVIEAPASRLAIEVARSRRAIEEEDWIHAAEESCGRVGVFAFDRRARIRSIQHLRGIVRARDRYAIDVAL